MIVEAEDGTPLWVADEGEGLPLLALPGLTRNGGDFDHLAPHLPGVRLIRLDSRGRGRSGHADPATYTVAQEAADALRVLGALGLDRVAILGTSRGGFVAMMMAHKAPHRLLGACLNDIGPVIEAEGLQAIALTLGRRPAQRTLEAAARARPHHLPAFRDVPHERWLHEVSNFYEETPQGLRLRYDPRLRETNLPQPPRPRPLAPLRRPRRPPPRPDPGSRLRHPLARHRRRHGPPPPRHDPRRGAGARPRPLPRRARVPRRDPRLAGPLPPTPPGCLMDIARIRAAAARAARYPGGAIRLTPLLSDPALDRLAGRRVLVKAECLQHTGSFKARGGWAAVSALPAGTRGVLAVSSGNHAQGVARAAALHGLPCAVVMPADAPRAKREATAAWGADVIPYDRAREDREALAARLAADRGLALVPPFDHPEVVAGQGTTGLEIAAQAAEAGVTRADVLVCTGGGGLAAGIALALAAEAPALRVRTVEPEGFDDAARSLLAGQRLSNPPGAATLCDAIMTPAPGRLTFPVLRRLAGPGLAVTDAEALRAMALAFRHLRIVLEPGGAVSLAAALFRPMTGEAVICVASGGNVDPEVFARALAA